MNNQLFTLEIVFETQENEIFPHLREHEVMSLLKSQMDDDNARVNTKYHIMWKYIIRPEERN